MCRANGASDSLAFGLQPLRVGLTSGAPPALGEGGQAQHTMTQGLL